MKPTYLPVLFDRIPETLTRERRWVLWRAEWDGTRWTKRPYQRSGVLARTDDPSTWCTVAEAVAAYRGGRFDGIGFVLGDGWAGVDVDHYRGHTWSAFDWLTGYRETSPSGDGFKVIGRGARIGGQINFGVDPPAFTTWEGARFFALTGHDATGDPNSDISQFIDDWFPAATPISLTSTREGYTLADEQDDEMLWAQMLGGGDERSEKLLALYRGDTSAYGGDHSRADQALVCHLAFWCNYNVDRIDRLFRQSGLYRPKWDHKSYRQATIAKACR